MLTDRLTSDRWIGWAQPRTAYMHGAACDSQSACVGRDVLERVTGRANIRYSYAMHIVSHKEQSETCSRVLIVWAPCYGRLSKNKINRTVVLTRLYLATFIDFLRCGRIACNAERCISHDNSVCPSVCLSFTRWYCNQTNEDRIMWSPLWGSKNTLVSWHQQWLGSNVPFHLKFALKVTHPLWKVPTSTNICL